MSSEGTYFRPYYSGLFEAISTVLKIHFYMKVIIYVPGLEHGYFRQSSIDSYAYRYLKAIDLADSDATKRYSLEYSKLKYGKSEEYLSHVATIRNVNLPNEITCKIFELDYSESLVKKYSEKNIFYKFLFTIYFFIWNGYKVLSSLFNGRFGSRKDTFQVAYMGFFLTLVSLGGIL